MASRYAGQHNETGPSAAQRRLTANQIKGKQGRANRIRANMIKQQVRGSIFL
jgi:hypothetical protein